MPQAIPFWIAFALLIGIAASLVLRPGFASSGGSALGGVALLALAFWHASGEAGFGSNEIVYVLVGGAITILSAISLDHARKVKGKA
jgi:hypothetical protein